MDRIEEYRAIIEDRIKNIDFPQSPENLYAPLRYFLSMGGKRTRPTLVMLGCQLFDVPGQKAINVAIAVELLHNFTLIHDDIMDEAPLRRGRKTVHTKWNRDIAVLSGDVLLIRAYDYLTKCDAAVLPGLLGVFNKAAKEVCEGQQMDIDFEKRDLVSISEYIEMIRLKTSVLLGAALEMGALIAGAKENSIRRLYNFGVNIGLAFQIQDDILDLYGNPDKFGKQVGGDVLENKKTLLLLTALHLANASQKKELDLMMQLSGQKKVEKARAIFDSMEAREQAKEMQDGFFKEALAELKKIQVKEENKKELISLSKFLIEREH